MSALAATVVEKMRARTGSAHSCRSMRQGAANRDGAIARSRMGPPFIPARDSRLRGYSSAPNRVAVADQMPSDRGRMSSAATNGKVTDTDMPVVSATRMVAVVNPVAAMAQEAVVRIRLAPR